MAAGWYGRALFLWFSKSPSCLCNSVTQTGPAADRKAERRKQTGCRLWGAPVYRKPLNERRILCGEALCGTVAIFWRGPGAHLPHLREGCKVVNAMTTAVTKCSDQYSGGAKNNFQTHARPRTKPYHYSNHVSRTVPNFRPRQYRKHRDVSTRMSDVNW